MTRLLDWLTGVLLSKRRIDHNPMYMCIMVWDMFAGTFAVLIGLPDSAMTRMSHYSTNLICWLMFIGGLTCLAGIVMGTKLDPGYWMRTVAGKTTRVDLRQPYLLGMLGTPMLMISFFYYSTAIFIQMPWASTQASEASLAMAVGAGALLNFIRFGLEIRNIGIKLPALIAKEIDMQISELQE
jgi:F0F1-type ATP synthase membrane subunit c/vacuolar-type H+-ATPase subunit K